MDPAPTVDFTCIVQLLALLALSISGTKLPDRLLIRRDLAHDQHFDCTLNENDRVSESTRG